VSVHLCANPPHQKVLKHLIYVLDGCGIHFKVLKHQLADWHCLDTHITMGFSCVSQFRGNVYGCNSVSVHPYAHLPPQKVLKLLIYVLDGCEL